MLDADGLGTSNLMVAAVNLGEEALLAISLDPTLMEAGDEIDIPK